MPRAGGLRLSDGVIDQFLEVLVVFTQHTAVARASFDWAVPTISQLSGFFAWRARLPAGVIHHKRDGTAAFQWYGRVAMVFRADDAHVHFLLVVQLVQQHFGRGTGGHDNRFAFQVSKIFDVAAAFGFVGQAGAHNEDGVEKAACF